MYGPVKAKVLQQLKCFCFNYLFNKNTTHISPLINNQHHHNKNYHEINNKSIA